jgi:hypothetical protein
MYHIKENQLQKHTTRKYTKQMHHILMYVIAMHTKTRLQDTHNIAV